MNLQQALEKCEGDLDDMMSSISGVKGELFARILSLHINFTTLVSLTAMLEEGGSDPRHLEALRKTAVLCASTTLGIVSELAKMSDDDVQEVIKWGETLHKMINHNLSLRKDH
jgi:hypothetical protein